jgi:hypothetical protein
MPPLKEQCAASPRPRFAAVSAHRQFALPTIIRPLSTRGSVVTEVLGCVTVQGIAARRAASGTRHSAVGHALGALTDDAEHRRTFCRKPFEPGAPNAECRVPSGVSLISQCLCRQNSRCGPRGIHRRQQRNSDGRCCHDHAVNRLWGEWDIVDGIDLG